MLTRTSSALLFVALFAIVMSVSLWSNPARSTATGGPGIVSVGYDHTCALLSSGGVQCWGANVSGQLGDGTMTNSSAPVDVCAAAGCSTSLSDVKSVSAGREHTCVITNAGGVKCWGANSLTQLGDGTDVQSSVPVDVVGLSSGVKQLSAGRYYNCVLTNSESAKCWGTNFYGQLGDGTHTDRATPADVSGLQSGVRSVATERYHTCAVMHGGTLRCWGDNANGQLGMPLPGISSPMDVCVVINQGCFNYLSGVRQVSLGLSSTCALFSTGGVQCWGLNDMGQLGNGSASSSPSPVYVTGLDHRVAALSVGEATACVLMDDAHVKCWGDNRFGQLGNGTCCEHSSGPVDVCADVACATLLSNVAAISVGAHQACAVMLSGGVKCWGLNSSGQLGDGTTTDRWVPVDALVAGTKPLPTATPTLAGMPDLVITSAQATYTFCSVAPILSVEFANVGSSNAGPFDVSVSSLTQRVADGLAAGDRRKIILGGAKFPDIVKIDPADEVNESDEENNAFGSKPGPTVTPCAPSPTPVGPTPTQTPQAIAGDANCDHTVNSIDAALVLQYVAGLVQSLPCQANADVGGPGSGVNAIDAALILQFVAGLIPHFV